ncbi:YaiI/YqxD family protein [Govanella unica]|uniref:UPF0178 protein NYP16_04910 n=1 Tax=Govanella unica TaxID=2975056 RepID=A0A9X3Z6U2_9PROT|nr:YaiI/YqxD family protein [Govania unica]MDA5193294.1 YaiI/YqxD family protein [Govania unica]
MTENSVNSPSIFVDGDACPVKDEIIRVAARHNLQVTMVSNQGLRASVGPNIKAILVGPEFDAADNWIAENCRPHDIVITADIQLAARCLKQGAQVIGHNGKPFTPDNIGRALASRELNQYLRESGEISGNNKTFSKKDRASFLQTLENVTQKILREMT